MVRSSLLLLMLLAMPAAAQEVNLNAEQRAIASDLENNRHITIGTYSATEPFLRASMQHIRVNPKDVRLLAKLPHLREIVVVGVDQKAIDAIIDEVVKLQGIHKLIVSGPCSSNAVAQIGKMDSLTDLEIHGDNLVDTDLRHLKGLTKLKSLVVASDKISEQGALRLKHWLPTCSVRNPKTGMPF